MDSLKKRVIITHGFSGNPTKHWYPWLKVELEKQGFEVLIPQMPHPDFPIPENWLPAFKQMVGGIDEQTYFVAHSLGSQLLVHFLNDLPDEAKVGGAVFVAGFLTHVTQVTDFPQAHEVAQHWLKYPIQFDKIKSHLNSSIAIFSDDDPYVPLDNKGVFEEKLGSKTIVKNKKGHFSDAEPLPIVLESVLSLTR